MPDEYDVIIAGAGLAGACAAFELARDRRVLLLEAEEPASGASGIAAGIANPLPSLWAKPVWRMEEAVDALDALLAEANAEDLVRREGLLRPASDARQAEVFALTANRLPEHATWLSADEVVEAYPDVLAPEGALWNQTACVISIPDLVRRLIRKAVDRGAGLRTGSILMNWSSGGDRVDVKLKSKDTPSDKNETLSCGRLILCLGREYVDFRPLLRLRLHQVKGQLVRVARPHTLGPIPHMAGKGYVLVEKDSLVLGSTFEHQFCDIDPDPSRSNEILSTVSAMIPALRDAQILEERAGVRVTVPGIRLPMVGPMPGEERVWIFTGLGSKGLLMAPMLSRELPRYLEQPESVPGDVRVRLLSR